MPTAASGSCPECDEDYSVEKNGRSHSSLCPVPDVPTGTGCFPNKALKEESPITLPRTKVVAIRNRYGSLNAVRCTLLWDSA